MKKFFTVLLFSIASLYSQSDCGNCWVAGMSCSPNKEPDCFIDGKYCALCYQIVECDDPACSYFTGLYCDCTQVSGQVKKDCLDRRAVAVGKNTVLRQQAYNRLYLQRRGNAKFTLFGLHLR